LIPDLTAVVTVYDNRCLVSEPSDPRVHGNEADPAGGVEAKVLVEIMIVQARNSWL